MPQFSKRRGPIARSATMAGLLAGSLLLTSFAMFAAEDYPKPIQSAVQAGVTVEKRFSAVSGLTGWVLFRDGQYSVVYTTADHKTLLAGTLIGEDGRNLSAEHEAKYVPKPDHAALFGELEKSTYVVEGVQKNPKSVIYVFVDPNCPFCNAAWRALQAYEKAGLQVRWVLVGTLGPTSMPKAVEILAASNPTAAFRAMEQNFGKAWKPSARSGANGPITGKIQRNGELMAKFGIGGTPGVVWKDKRGSVNVKAGMPRLSELPAITGMPEQTIDDPSLARFR